MQIDPYAPLMEVEEMLRQPLSGILEVVKPSPSVLAELRDAMVAEASNHLHYVWLELRYAPVLGSWCQMADNYERLVGRPRLPGELDAQPITRAVVKLYRFEYLNTVLEELPTGLPEWDALRGVLERIYRRQVGSW